MVTYDLICCVKCAGRGTIKMTVPTRAAYRIVTIIVETNKKQAYDQIAINAVASATVAVSVAADAVAMLSTPSAGADVW